MSTDTRKPDKKKAATAAESPAMMAIRELAEVPQLDSRAVPTVDFTTSFGELGGQLGALLHGKIFNQNGQTVRVNESTGDVAVMTPNKFRSWLEKYALVGTHRRGEFVKCSMGKDTAQGVLECDQFLELLLPLNGVQTVRVPVWNEDRSRVELLPPGYHARTGIYTVDMLPYDHAMVADEARAFLLSYFDECAWAEDGPLAEKRSFCAFLASMLTCYMLEMFPPEVGRMGFFFTANERGAGKSTLAECALAPVFGDVVSLGWSRNDETNKKELDAVALEGGRYLFLDNVTGKINSAHLAKFISASSVGFRLMAQHKTGSGRNRRVVFLTGNGARADADLESRLLPIQLHVALDALERLEQIKHPITKEEFQSPAMRRKFLACLWALVDHWNCHQCRRVSKTHTRFKDWEGVIGGVLECAAFGSAFTRPLMGMDDQSEAWRMFFVKLAGEMKSTADLFTVDECLSVARENDLLDDMLPATVGKDDGLNHAFGIYVRRRYDKGKEFKNEQGRWCVFRKANDGHKGSRYQVELKDVDAE